MAMDPAYTPKLTAILIEATGEAVAYTVAIDAKRVSWRVRPRESDNDPLPGPVRWTTAPGQAAGVPIAEPFDVLRPGETWYEDQTPERPWGTLHFSVPAGGVVPCVVVIAER